MSSETTSTRRARPSLGGLAALSLMLAALLAPGTGLAANTCTNPGKDGPGASVGGVVNSYYPGLSVSAGSVSLPVGALDTTGGGSATPIGPGDLLLVMQMQDADLNITNGSAYGGSAPGSGQTALNGAGLYEYATVSLAYTSGSPIVLAAPLKNSYRSAAATGTAGQRTFQVVRVPQYSSAALGGTLSAGAWNGATGGVVAIDVGGQLNWNGGTIDVTGLGFRGGAGLYLNGKGASQPAYASTDYVATLLPTLPVISPNPDTASGPSAGAHGVKGEGIAGTPRYLFVPAAARAAVNGLGAVFDTGVEGYPGGSMARGAPGNGGGGGSDGDPAANDQNTGGGGGGGYASGGSGGYGWTPTTPPGSPTGGFGGAGIPMSASRLTMGGGGGSGSTNNGTGNPNYGLASSGAPGGGIVLVRARTIIGSGTINAAGTAGNPNVCNDASGGGGGGGSVLVYASGNNGNVGTLAINASGGAGGSNTGAGTGENLTACNAYNNQPHGPGGGGGGGFVALSSTASASITVSGASGGTTSPSNTSTAPYGSSASPGGYQINSVVSTDLPGATPSPLCFPLLTTTKTTSAANTVQGGTTTYVVTVSNAAGYGLATGVAVKDTLPAPFTLAGTTSITLTGGATRTTVSDPAAGASTPVWGAFTLPAGASVRVTFTVTVPVATPLGTYQNPASVTYDDPTRSTAGQTVTPGGTYSTGGFVLGANYDPNGSAGEDVMVRQPATLAKSFTPPSAVAGSTVSLAITVTNPNAVALTSASLTDVFPGGLVSSGSVITVSGSGCTAFSPSSLPAGALQLAVTGGTVPANGTCTFTTQLAVNSASAATNTLPAGAFTNALNVINTAAAGATLLSRPTVVKSFSPAAVPANTSATLSFAITNPNATPLTGAALSDPFPSGLVAVGGAVTVAGAGCTGFAPATVTANATSFALTAGTLPAATTCTVSFAVKAAVAGAYVNSATGVNTTETGAAGTAPAAAQLGVGLIGVGKAFSPARIAPGGSATVTLTLVNPTAVAQTAGAFTDTLVGLTAAGGAVTTTCTTITPATLAAAATALSFTNVGIPAAGCTISFAVTAAASGTKTNTTGGVSTALLPAGPASNTATLLVAAPPAISEAFSPATVQTGQPSTLTFTLVNGDTIPLTGASFTDTLAGGLQIATSGAVGGTCPGASALSVTAGATALSFTGLTIPSGAGGCTVTVKVTAAAAGSYPNAASGVSSTEAAIGAAAASATLTVVATPTITKAFATSPISQNGTSVLTFTLANPNTTALTGGAFNDNLVNMAIAAPGGPAGGTCTGASANTFTTGATALSFTGLTLGASASCTVTVTVTSNASGANANTASGVTTAQTPVAGAASNTATLSVLQPASLSAGFSPGVILSTASLASSTTTLTVTLTNSNASALTGVAFSDALSSLAVAAAGAAGGTCAGAAGNTFTAGATSLSFTGLTVPANGSCTVTVVLSSAALSPAAGWPTTTSGATSTQTPLAGAGSNTASLVVIGYATVAKAFSVSAIASGGTSVLTFTLSNPNAIALSGAAFSDTFPAGMQTTNVAQSFIGAGRGTCTGAIPSAAAAGAQTASVTFAGISLPPSSTCTVMVDVTATATNSYVNTASGVTTNQTGAAAGPVSNSATLAVGRLGVAKSFSPATIGLGETSTVTLAINNTLGFNATNVAITDTLPAGMTISGAGASSCGGTVTAAGNTFSLTGATVANGTVCTMTAPVVTSSAGTFLNTTGTVSYRDNFLITRTGPTSNTAALTVVAKPGLAKAFSPATVDAWRNSTLTFTLTNPNASAPLTGCTFTDTLTGFFVSNPPALSGSCVGVTSTPALAVNQTSLSLAVPQLNPGSCTISLPVTSGTAGAYPNTASGVKCNETTSAGAASNTATVTFAKLPIQITKSASLVKAPPGTAVTYTISYTNPNTAMALQNIVITDTTPQFTSFQSATCAALPASLTSCTVTAPTAGQSGTVTWTLGGTLDPQASGTVSLTVTIN